ncbi:MAG: dTDP-4-dehydrorhamnose reductase [Elusimicrobiota bacterium]|nr:dTDP-4-dehydrorhamnose reductase [Endomicrobiia bacterium]MDW8166392.1 dTDP-4-dehydrorhamnose reductase [Elusimicrobiota bacterium]
MKIVVFGGRGQLGNDVFLTVPKNVELIVPLKEEVDVGNRDQVVRFAKKVGSVDFVFYLAGYVKVDLAEEELYEVFKVNTFGIKNVIEFFYTTPVVYISTDYVFDGSKEGEPYYEDDIPNPINIYGISKYAGELIVKSYVNKYYIVRTASLFGKLPSKGKGTNFVYTILNKLENNETIKVVNDVFMSPTYTFDLAKSIWELVERQYPYGVYHITNSGYCSWYEFAKYIAQYAGFVESKIYPVSSMEFSAKAKRPKWSVLGSRNFPQIRGWQQALKEFIESILHK